MELPPRRFLISVQRVCRQWQAVIQSSTPIQQALFLKPIAPIYLRKIPQSKHRYYFHMSETDPDAAICYHPAFIQLLNDRCKHRPLPPSFGYRHASWRRSLLSHPPLGIILGETADDSSDGDGKVESRRIEAPPGGFTLEYVVEGPSTDLLTYALLRSILRQTASSDVKSCAWKHNSAKKFLFRITGGVKLRK